MTELNLFIPITKIDAAQRLVFGTLTEEIADKSGEIIDYESTKAAYELWSADIFKASGGKSKGNLRAMHGKVAAGKFNDIVFDDEARKIQGIAYVADDQEWKKVEAGVYTGFSHGGAYKARWKDPANPELTRYTPTLAEVSLVDNPCVATATFEFIKEDGSAELRKFNRPTEEQAPMTDPIAETTEDRPQDKGGVTQGWQAQDGTFHLAKADALNRNTANEAEAEAGAAAAPALAALEKLDAALAKAEAKPDAIEDPADAETKEPDDATTEEPEEPAEKADAAVDLNKGMPTVSAFAELLQSIQYLQQDTKWEAERENDNSEMPAKLKAWLADGGALLQEMAGEEAAELTADKAAGGALAKAGARNSKADAERVQKLHDTSVDLGADCDKAADAGKSADGDLAKAAAERDALAKALGDMAPKLETLLLRIESLEAQPAAPKGALRAVDKAADSGGGGGDPLLKFNEHLAGLDPEQRRQALMKAALSQPLAMA